LESLRGKLLDDLRNLRKEIDFLASIERLSLSEDKCGLYLGVSIQYSLGKENN